MVSRFAVPLLVTGLLAGSFMLRPSYAADRADLFTLRKQVQEARVTFSVQDARGGPVTGLTPRDIRLVNDGQTVSEITSFFGYENVPLRVTILIDASDSMSRRFNDECTMAQTLLQSIVRPGLDDATVTSFASKPQAIFGPTVNRVGFRNLEPNGPTALYDSIYQAMLPLSASSTRPTRRILILFSDGEDNWSEHSLEDAISAAQDADASIYPITAHSRRYVYVGDKVLRTLAESTGGHVFFLTNFDKPGLIYTAIQAELRAHYVVGFRPSTSSSQPGFHTIKIFAKNSKFKVRSRTGYYVESAITQ